MFRRLRAVRDERARLVADAEIEAAEIEMLGLRLDDVVDFAPLGRGCFGVACAGDSQRRP